MISVGKIIEYLDNGKFICGFVTEYQQKRVHLFNHNRREVKLPVSRIISCSEKTLPTTTEQEQLFSLLQEINEERNALKQQINLEDIWEIICEEPESSFTPGFLAELAFGEEADDDSRSALIRAVLDNKVYFRFKEGQIKAQTQEQVSAQLEKEEREREKKRIIHEGSAILSQLNSQEKPDLSLLESAAPYLKIIQDYYLFEQDSENREVAQQILKEAGLTKPHATYYLLVRSGIWQPHENIPLLRSGVPVQFSQSALQQAEATLQLSTAELLEDPLRKDFTHLRPLTIDGATTLDFDDALTIEKTDEGLLLGVHISDVSHYVKPGDALFEEAMQRGTSLYFPQSQIPMLPKHLSQGVCSLVQGEIRAAVSFMILLSESAEILRTRIFSTAIRVARRLTYEEADAIMESDAELSILRTLSGKLREKRLENGALLLPFPDVNVHVDSAGKVAVSLGATDTPSRILVSEMMILANEQAAKYIADRMVPGLFRAQEPPKQRLVNGEDNDLFINTRQRKQLARGELLIHAKRHAGLGVNQYTTVTSPIRRLLDLVMQHQLHSVIRREEPRFTADMCNDFTSVITRTLSQANAVKQQRHRYWLLVYLADRVGQYIDALVIESGPKRTTLLIPEILFDVALPAPGGSKPAAASTVKIRIIKSDPLENAVLFGWD